MYKKEIKISLPKSVKFILNEFNNNGYKAYIVGGCVRDSLMGKIPNDWDITTELTPEEVKSLFEGFKIIDKGIEFGTIALYIAEEEFEITTFRKDCGTKDCRHPESVTFSSRLEEDLSRRDFTVNALAYNNEDGLIDCFNGYEDLMNRILRAVGNPYERFKEDALRMIRAIRLSAQHGFNIEKSTYEAIRENYTLIEHISHERFNKELVKILESDNPDYIEKLYETGISKIIFNELNDIFECVQDNPNHYRGDKPTTVGEHTMDTLKAAAIRGKEDEVYNDLSVRLALLIHDFGKPSTKSVRLKKGYGNIDSFIGHAEASVSIAENCLRRLKFPNKVIEEACLLAKHHDIEVHVVKDNKVLANGYALRKAYFDFGGAKKGFTEKANILIDKLFAVRICDAAGQNPEKVEGFNMQTSSEKVCFAEKAKEHVDNNREILNIALPINGLFIKEILGMSKSDFKSNGKVIGVILNKIQSKVIKDNSFLNNLEGEFAKEYVFKFIKSMNLTFENFSI